MAYYKGREAAEHGSFTSLHPASFLPPSSEPQGSRERASVRSCVGMAVCVTEGVGPFAANGALHEFVMSAMLAMAHWTGEEQRSIRKKRPTESDRDPGPTRLCSRCYGPKPTDCLQETVTDSSMRTRGRPAIIPSRPNRFMLRLLA